jgi:hypothetical protein
VLIQISHGVFPDDTVHPSQAGAKLGSSSVERA